MQHKGSAEAEGFLFLGSNGWKMMAGQALHIGCEILDHDLVRGVACDGEYGECRYLMRTVAPVSRDLTHLYLLEVADWAQPGEFDAIRSDS